MKLYKSILKMLVEKGRVAQHIDTTTKTELDTLIDNISRKQYLTLEYSDFDQSESTDITFDDLNRTITASSDDAELVTDEISLSDIEIRSLHVNSTGTTINQITTDNSVFYVIPEFDINDTILQESPVIDLRFKFVLALSGDVVTNAIIVYDTVDV